MSSSQKPQQTFQEQRRKGLGASDTAAILGLSDWGNAYTVAVEKIFGTFQEESEPMYWGKRLEDIVLEEFTKRTGIATVKPKPFWAHTKHKWLYANCDGVENNVNPSYVAEAKTSRFGDGFGPDGTDECPDLYNIQAQHQMMITGARLAYVPALIGGNNFRCYKVPYSQEIVDSFMPVLEDFWDRFVSKRVLPEPDFKHPATFDVLKKVVGLNDTIMNIDEDNHPLYDLATRYELMRRVEKCAKDEKASLKSQMITQSGGAAVIMFPDGTKVSRKTKTRREYVVKSSTYETFTLTWKGDEQNGNRLVGVEPLKLGDGRPGEETGE